jgi:hypothetical protein
VTDAFGNVAPTTAAPRKRGRPVKREPVHRALRDGQVLGRDGEALARSRITGYHASELDIPEHLRDPRYDLQWCRTSCFGRPDNANINLLKSQGWREVHPKNYPGVMPDMQHKHTIERDGLILMERPMQLTQEAVAEQHADALELRQVQTEQFGNRKLPRGFDEGYMARNRDGSSMDARRKVVRDRPTPSPRELRPAYDYAGPGDDE